MQKKYNKLTKTLGPLAAKLVAELYERNRPIFHFSEAEEILGGRIAANNVLQQLVRHNVVTRLKPGTFSIIPFQLEFEEEYLGNSFVIAREITLKGQQDRSYYLSHASAFELHQMVTQPQFVAYVTTTENRRSYTIHGLEIRFVYSPEKNMFGMTEIWVDKHEKVILLRFRAIC